MGTMASRKLRVFTDGDVSKIADPYHNWRTSTSSVANEDASDAEPVEVYEDIAGFCKAATIEEVQKQDYKLTPGIYVGTEAEAVDGIPFEEKMAGLKTTLLEQFEKGEELKKQIIDNFNKI